MTDRARELAHRILRQDVIPPLCSRGISNRHSQTCELITATLRAARKESLEEAAKVAESNDAYGSCGGIKREIAADICKLMGESNDDR